MSKRVKIYGERNTGTNYLATLLSRNLEVELLPGVVPRRVARLSAHVDRVARPIGSRYQAPGDRLKDLWFTVTFDANLGWKHMLVSSQRLEAASATKDTVFVALVKNPYSWALSLFKRPYHRFGSEAETLAQFLDAPWRTVGREHAPNSFANPIDMWNQKCQALQSVANSFPAELIRYEDVLSNPASIINKVGRRCDAQSSQSGFQNVSHSTKAESDKDYNYYRSYYLDEIWRNSLSKQTLKIITGHLDCELAASLGYEPIRSL